MVSDFMVIIVVLVNIVLEVSIDVFVWEGLLVNIFLGGVEIIFDGMGSSDIDLFMFDGEIVDYVWF